MSQERFQRTVDAEARALEAMLVVLDGGKQPAGEPVDLGEFPHLYRRICQRLALARHRRYSADLLGRLNDLALRGHARLYARDRGGELLDRFARMVLIDFPRALRAEAGLFWAALLLFFGTFAAVGLAVWWDPELVFTLMNPTQVGQLEAMYDPASDHFLRERASSSDVAMFGFYIRNNIGIGLRTFAGGVLAGVGSVFFLVYNGLFLGAATGHIASAGLGSTFFPFVVAHGAFELTAIAIAGMAGLKLGVAVLAPGRLRRTESLAHAARASLPLVAGFVAMLLVAAFIEAFWSSSHTLPLPVRYGVGALMWGAVLAWLSLAGRAHAA